MKLTKILSLVFVPLALCATIPESKNENNFDITSIHSHHLDNSQPLANQQTFEQGLAMFLLEARRLADQAILEESRRINMEDGPTNLIELLDMIFSDQSISAAQATGVTGLNPFQSIVSGIGGVVSGLTGVVTGALNGNTGAVGSILTRVVEGTASTSTTSADPLTTVLGGIGNAIDSIIGVPVNGSVNSGLGGILANVTSGLANTTTIIVGDLTNLVSNVSTGVASGLNSTAAGLTGGLVNVTTGVIGGLGDLVNATTGVVGNIGGLINATTGILGGLTNGAVKPPTVLDLLHFAGNAISGIANGSLTVPALIDQIIKGLSNASKKDDPIGTFIKNVATFLNENQNGPLINFIKFNTFVHVVMDILVKLTTANSANMTDKNKGSIVDAIVGAIGKIIAGGLTSKMSSGRFENISVDELSTQQNAFAEFLRAQTLPSSSSYALQLMNIARDIVSKLFVNDPFILKALSNPTEENVQQAVTLVAKILTDHNV